MEEKNSSLSADVIPTLETVQSIEEYIPKFSPEIIKMIADKQGLNTNDERVYDLMAIAVEILMTKLFDGIYDVDNRNKKDLKTHLIHTELSDVLSDFLDKRN